MTTRCSGLVAYLPDDGEPTLGQIAQLALVETLIDDPVLFAAVISDALAHYREHPVHPDFLRDVKRIDALADEAMLG